MDKYPTNEANVNDGYDDNDDPTLGINADFNHAIDANAFHAWLKTFIEMNSIDFKSARTRVHDCFHASDQNLPCEMGDVWRLKKTSE